MKIAIKAVGVYRCIIFLCFFVCAAPVYASVCLVPEGECTTTGTPCDEDYLVYPATRVGGAFEDDGDTTTVSDQHQQNTGTQAEYVMDVCYQAENNGKVGGIRYKITPTEMSVPTDCKWECLATDTTCAGEPWHKVCSILDSSDDSVATCFGDKTCPKASSGGVPGDSILLNLVSLGDKYPDPFPTTNVILSRLTFSSVTQDAATLEATCTSNLCGVAPANIATIDFADAGATYKIAIMDAFTIWVCGQGNNQTTVTPCVTPDFDIQVIATQCVAGNPAGGNIDCTASTGTGADYCPVTAPAPAYADISLTWSAPTTACTGTSDCGALTYNIYEGGVSGTGNPVGTVSTTATGPTKVLGINNTLTYYVYAKTANCSESPTSGAVQLTTANCSCRTATVVPTSVKVDNGAFSTAKPQAGDNLTITGTLDDEGNAPGELTVKIFYGCSSLTDGCPNGGYKYATPNSAVICEPPPSSTGKPACGNTISYTLSGNNADFEDEESAQSLRVAFQVLLGTSVLSAEPANFAGDLTNYDDYEIDEWSFSPYLIFKKDNEPYPSEMPFVVTGGNYVCLNFELIEKASVTLRIYHPDGTLIRVLDNDATENVASCAALAENKCNWQVGCKWDGTSYLGSDNLVANGMYLLHLYAVGTGASYSGNIVERRNGIVVMK